MTTVSRVDYLNLQRAFDILLEENRRIISENALLRAALQGYADGFEKIRLIEGSLAPAYREQDDSIKSSAVE